jgi:uroporphyrinogen-III synthase
MKSTNESNAREEMARIWGDVIESVVARPPDVDGLEARVKELEQELSSARFLIHAEQVAREDLDRRLGALTDRFDKYVFYTEKTLDDVCERWIPGLMDRLNDLEKKA